MSAEPATPSPEADRPGGWVDGIGWVALLRDLENGTVYKIGTDFVSIETDAFYTRNPTAPGATTLVIVTAWPDGTTPEPPAAPSSSGEAQRVEDDALYRWREHREHPCAGACIGCGAGVDEPCIPPCRCDDGEDCEASREIMATPTPPAASGEAQDPPEAEMVLADLRPILSDLTAAVLAWRNEYRQDVERAAAKDKTNDWASARILACDAFLALLAPAGGEGTDR